MRSPLFHSDAMFLPVMFSDIFRDDGSFTDWHLPRNLYFFPEYPLFGMAYLLADSTYHQIPDIRFVADPAEFSCGIPAGETGSAQEGLFLRLP